MEYHGKLFGNIPNTRRYFDTGRSSKDWDCLLESLTESANAWEAMLEHARRIQCAGTEYTCLNQLTKARAAIARATGNQTA